MDGFKNRLNESIQLKLSFTLSVAIFFVALAAGLFSFLSAFDEAHELQDDVLRQVAQLMAQQNISNTSLVIDVPPSGADEEARVIVQVLDEELRTSSAGIDEGGALPLPSTLGNGLQTLDLGGESFRVLVKTAANGKRFVVAQEAAFRNEIARYSALRTVMPFLILVPVLLLIVANLIRKIFQPIAQLSKEIDQRTEMELHPIEANSLPVEIRPFVLAINHLFGRVGQSIESQRRFIADAAHELRSPLTALSLQAERLSDTDMSTLARERLLVLRQGIERGRKLLNQLLSLARALSHTEQRKGPVPVQSIFRRVLEDLMPLVEEKNIDIGVEGTQDALVMISDLDMITVVKNLLDNAIRYTPAYGRIDLSIHADEACAILNIKDTGPGIPMAERDRIFDPFYRTLGAAQLGSGLGLSIVQAIAQRNNAKIQLAYTDEMNMTGLSITLRFPLAPESRQ